MNREEFMIAKREYKARRKEMLKRRFIKYLRRNSGNIAIRLMIFTVMTILVVGSFSLMTSNVNLAGWLMLGALICMIILLNSIKWR